MKIAIILAVFVVFASGTYAAFAEEPLPELIFDGGDMKVYKGNSFLKSAIVQIENHDHKIHPKIHVIFENQIIDTILLGHSSSGFYQTFLNIDKNYQSGNYNLQLEYDNTKTKPVPFKIIKEFEEQKERTLGFGDYTQKQSKPKEASIQFSKDHIDIEFSTSTTQTISGIYDSKGTTGKIQLQIDGPKSMTNNVRITEDGFFTTELIIDREWPTGNYKVTGTYHGKSFLTDDFTIKNFNKDSLLKKTPIEGTINLDSMKSKQFNVIMINGQLLGKVIPEKIAMKVFHEENLIDTSYHAVKPSGIFEIDLVLYDHMKKSNWEIGKYLIEIANANTLESYEIKSKFEFTHSGNTITDFDHGMVLTSESELLNFIDQIEVEKYHPKEIKVFGIIEGYISGTPIIISIVNEQGNVTEFSILAKKSGEYDAPVIINSEWIPGKYTIYVKYNDEIENSISFNIEDEKETIAESLDIEKDEIIEEREIEKFNIIQNDSITDQIVRLEFSTKIDKRLYNTIDVTLEKPNGDTSTSNVKTANDGNVDYSLIIENSWDEGNYFLYFVEDDEKITFGEFTITKEKDESENMILSEILQTANPESIYQQTDEIKISKKNFNPSREGLYLDLSGTIKDYSLGETSLNIFEKNTLLSTHKINPKSNGVFFSPIWIDGEISKGFHEVNVTYDERVIGKSEILITSPITIYAEFGSKPIKISQDMFVESNNKVGVYIFGLVEGFNNTNHNPTELTILHPNGQIENVQLDTAKWGHYSHTLSITDKWKTGTYIISAKFDDEKLGHVYMQIMDFDINWLKIHTQKWIDGKISSYQYENRINQIIEHNLIQTDPIEQDSLPDWMKMNAKKWIDGEISQKEYFSIIKFIAS